MEVLSKQWAILSCFGFFSLYFIFPGSFKFGSAGLSLLHFGCILHF
jgi:hypothetical protein